VCKLQVEIHLLSEENRVTADVDEIHAYLHLLIKASCTEFHESPTDPLVVDLVQQTGKRSSMWSVSVLLHKEV
jgi:hypothetical protein